MKYKFSFNDHLNPDSKIRILPEFDGYKGYHTIKMYSLDALLTDEFRILLQAHGITQYYKSFTKILFYSESDRDLAKYLI